MIGPIVNPLWQEWAATALAEGRLSWRVTDAQGRPCNGGDTDPIALGEWSPTIEDAKLCHRGWHTTLDPLRWTGSRVWLVEGDGLVGTDGDKACWLRIRPLAEVDPRQSVCQRVAAAAMRPYLTWAYLRGANLCGAYLSETDLEKADLTGADLSRAYLRGADLSGADLTRADLRGAYLAGADLRGATLSWADLTRADLSGADLGGATLSWANLSGADLFGADLSRANLDGADLTRADLTRADLGAWERGPNGYARRVTP